MDAFTLLLFLNYSLVLIFGLFLSAYIAGSWETKGQKHLIFALTSCPMSRSPARAKVFCTSVTSLFPSLIASPRIRSFTAS